MNNSFGSATNMINRIKLNSILNLFVWLIAFCILGLVVCAIFSVNATVLYFFMYIIGMLVIITILCFLGILIWGNPTLLRSEEHEYRMKQLEILGDEKHNITEIKETPSINNPSLPDPQTPIMKLNSKSKS